MSQSMGSLWTCIYKYPHSHQWSDFPTSPLISCVGLGVPIYVYKTMNITKNGCTLSETVFTKAQGQSKFNAHVLHVHSSGLEGCLASWQDHLCGFYYMIVDYAWLLEVGLLTSFREPGGSVVWLSPYKHAWVWKEVHYLCNSLFIAWRHHYASI